MVRNGPPLTRTLDKSGDWPFLTRSGVERNR